MFVFLLLFTMVKRGVVSPMVEGKCHLSLFPCRQTRKYMQNWIKPGVKLIDMCEHLEEIVRTLVQANGLEAGI